MKKKYYFVISKPNSSDKSTKPKINEEPVSILVNTNEEGKYTPISKKENSIGYSFYKDVELENLRKFLNLEDNLRDKDINAFYDNASNKNDILKDENQINEFGLLSDNDVISITAEISLSDLKYISKISKSIILIELDKIDDTNSDEILNDFKVLFNREESIDPIENTNLLNFIKPILEAQKSNNLVVFVGAGFSKNYGFPLWGEIIETMKKDFHLNESDYLKVAQLVFDKLEKNAFYNYLDKWFKITQKRNQIDLDKLLFQLEPSHIVTTNYDNILDNSEYNLEYHSIRSDSDLSYAKTNTLLIKMHGDYESRNIVFTEDDYLAYKFTFPLIRNYIISLFSTKTFLFLGFSYEDINLKFILKELEIYLGKDNKKINIFFTPPKNDINDKYLEKRGANVFHYENSIEGYLKNYVEEVNIVDLNNKNLDHKTMLTNFLSLLNKLKDTYIDDINFDNENSLNYIIDRYAYIPSFSPYQLIKHRPFKEYRKNKAKHDFNYYEISNNELRLYDKKLWQRIENYSKKKNDKLIEDILLKLHISGVFQIRKAQTTPYRSIQHTFVKTNFNCIIDSLYKGKIFDVIKKCNSIDSNPTHYSTCELNKSSFILFNFGFRYKAYVISNELIKRYQEIGDKYNLLRVQYNLNQARFSIEADYEELVDEKIRKEIFEKLEKYNVEDDLSKSKLDDFSKENFRDVVIFKNRRKFYSEIIKFYEELIIVYKGYKKGGFTFHGPDYNHIIYRIYASIYYRHINNHMFTEFFSDEKEPATKFFWSQVFATNISDNYDCKNKEGIDSFAIKTLLFKLNSKDIFDFHDKNPELRFFVSNEGIVFIKDFINNLSDSYFSEEYLTSESETKYQIRPLLLNYNFKKFTEDLFEKLIYFISYLKVNDDDLKEITIKVFKILILLIKSECIIEKKSIGAFTFLLLKYDLFQELFVILYESKYKNELLGIVEEYLEKSNDKMIAILQNSNLKFLFNDINKINYHLQNLLCFYTIEINNNLELNNIEFDINKLKNELLCEFILHLKDGRSNFFNNVNMLTMTQQESERENEYFSYLPQDLNIIISFFQKYPILVERYHKNISSPLIKFLIEPNNFNYSLLEPKWIFNFYAIKNIPKLNTETCIIWLIAAKSFLDTKEITDSRVFNLLAKRIGENNS